MQSLNLHPSHNWTCIELIDCCRVYVTLLSHRWSTTATGGGGGEAGHWSNECGTIWYEVICKKQCNVTLHEKYAKCYIVTWAQVICLILTTLHQHQRKPQGYKSDVSLKRGIKLGICDTSTKIHTYLY